MAVIPKALRSCTPTRLRDDVRLRALGVGFGLIPPRSMHSSEDARVLREAATGAKTAVEIGVYEGASALTLLDVLEPNAELHLIDPFGHHRDALPGGWGASEWATRRMLARASRRRGSSVDLRWHVAFSDEVARSWSGAVDLVFIDGDHSQAGCERDWACWHPHVAVGGRVVFHDARADQVDGRGLPGPTAVLAGLRAAPPPNWTITAEADRTVALRRRG